MIKRNMIMKLLWIVDIFSAHKIWHPISNERSRNIWLSEGGLLQVLKKLMPAINQKFRKFSLEIIIFKNRQSNMFLKDVSTLRGCQNIDEKFSYDFMASFWFTVKLCFTECMLCNHSNHYIWKKINRFLRLVLKF